MLKYDYEFYIITRNTDLGSNEAYKEIRKNTLFENEGVFYYYFSEDQLNALSVINKINSLSPDLIYLNSFWSYPFSINIVRAKKSGSLKAPILLAPRGMLSTGALGLKSLKKNAFLTISKLFNWYKEIPFHATNEEEKGDILKQFPKAEIFMAPNVNSGTVYTLSKPKEKNHIKLFYLSRIARVKNLHFALEVLNLIPDTYQVEYDIYGNIEDAAYWKECKRIIEKLPANIKVKYRHELQFNEVQSIIVSYHCLFLPTLNENFGHSIVESLLCGCPVIISDQTPWNDVFIGNSGQAIPLNNIQNFVDCIKHMASLNNEEYAIKSAAAIHYISGKLNIAQSIAQYKTVFNESAKK
ncbi:MAG: glycosyltransferase [Bacteroidetes bacterium]|nr:glycosyltransferase [Bacteroidota bacterium]